ncbi:hypothetical protein Tco_0732315, partial [Tanacetum coccineum]
MVATISANGEREIGELIARAIEKVRKDGDDNTLDNELEVVEGMKLGRGIRASVDFYSRQKDFTHELTCQNLGTRRRVCFEDGSTADHTVRDVVIKLIFDGLENRLLSVIESLLFVAYPESMFWDPDSFVDGPVRCLLYNLEGEFPFRTVELIRLLSALSEGAWPAECVR